MADKFILEWPRCWNIHDNDVTMSAMASQITGVTIVYSTVCSGAYQKKHQSSASLAFVRGLHRWPVNSSHKGPVKRKMFPFDDVIISWCLLYGQGLTKHHSCRVIEKLICMTWLHTHAVASMVVQWKSMMTSSNGNISALLAICAGNSPVPGEFPAQRPVTRIFDVFFDLRLNKRLSKPSWGWWFETPSRP